MKSIFFIPLLILCFSVQGFSQKSETFTTAQGALRGYDPVAYFKEGKPAKGNNAFTYSWNGADWHFSSLQNKEAFEANPEKFAPQYGGYCAYGMAEGHKAPTDPQAWTIVDDKLYLNYSKDVQQLWKKTPEEFIQTADKNWPVIVKKE